MRGRIGCLLNASETSSEVVSDLASRLGVTSLFVRGAMRLPGLKTKAPASSPDGNAPGLQLTNDDSALRSALDAARGGGTDAYIVLANPLSGASDWSGLLARDNGGRSAAEVDPENPTLCPNRPELMKWLAASAAAVVKTYNPTGVLLDDFSLGSPEKLDTLFMCWCDLCRARAGELGYDPDRIKMGMQGARSKLRQGKLALGIKHCGIGQYIEAIGYDTGLLDWLNFRADSVSACLYEVRQAVTGSDSTLQVGVTSKGPTISILAGQRRADLLRDNTIADFYAPLICGPRSGVLTTIAAHAKALQTTDQADAVALSARLHGYGDLPVDISPEQLAGEPAIELVVASAERELELVMATSGGVPRLPGIDVHGLPGEITAKVAALVNDAGAEGLLYLGVPH